MRPSLWLTLLLVVAVSSMVAISARPSQTIRKLKLIVRTGDGFGASTTQAVWFSLGPSYEWALETVGRAPFRNGASDVFNLPPHGLRAEDIKYVKLRKSRGDGWYLQGIEIWIDGRPFYRNPEINTWLEGNQLEWVAPDFPSARS